MSMEQQLAPSMSCLKGQGLQVLGPWGTRSFLHTPPGTVPRLAPGYCALAPLQPLVGRPGGCVILKDSNTNRGLRGRRAVGGCSPAPLVLPLFLLVEKGPELEQPAAHQLGAARQERLGDGAGDGWPQGAGIGRQCFPLSSPGLALANEQVAGAASSQTIFPSTNSKRGDNASSPCQGWPPGASPILCPCESLLGQPGVAW